MPWILDWQDIHAIAAVPLAPIYITKVLSRIRDMEAESYTWFQLLVDISIAFYFFW